MSVEVIAEVSTNHGGHLSLAKEFIDAFAPHVDTIKFQLTRVKHLRADSQWNWFRRAELTLDQFAELKSECEKRGKNFLLTVYNANDVWELVELGCKRVKIGSGEAGESYLAHVVAAAELKPIVSCGLHTPSNTSYPASTVFLGCVTRYPAPDGLAALALQSNPTLSGWSDHAVGLNELKAAACVGARILETHVCLPQQAREHRWFEKTVDNMNELRVFLAADPKRFLGRWQG